MNGGNHRSNIILIAALAICAGVLSYGFYQPYDKGFSFAKKLLEEKTSQVSVLVVGDMMLDRNVRLLINRNGFDKFFGGVEDLVKGADIAVANLEGAFTPYPSVTTDFSNKELKFTFDPALAPKLADLGFDILGLANNHSWNFGREGFEMTRRYIGSAGMMYYGDPNNASELSTVFTKNGISIAFVGFHEFHYSNFDKVYAEIERLRKEVDVVIVTPHWGPEYEKVPTEKMRKWAHEFVDSGADAVIGSHSHVIGDTEMYRGKKIYYSLGNFAFDQYFSKATMEGLGVRMNIEKNERGIGLAYENIVLNVDREGVRVSTSTLPSKK